MLHSFLQGISITKSLGTFWRLGSCIVTRPVDVKVSTMLCIRSIASLLQQVLPRCSGNTTLVSAAVKRRHSSITPGSGWSGRSFSRISLAVLHTGLARLKITIKILQCKSKNLPWGLVAIIQKRLGIFQPNFTCLLCVPIYARLRIFVQLSATLTKLCHIKRDHPVHIMCAKCTPSAKTNAGIFWHFSQTVRIF